MLRRLRQHLLGRGDIQGNIALAGLLVEQLFGQGGGVGKGMPDQQPAPAAMYGHGAGIQFAAVFGKAGLQAFVRRRLATQ